MTESGTKTCEICSREIAEGTILIKREEFAEETVRKSLIKRYFRNALQDRKPTICNNCVLFPSIKTEEIYIKNELEEDTKPFESMEFVSVEMNISVPEVVEVPKESLFYCHNCNYSTIDKRVIAIHVKNHQDSGVKKRYKCNICDYSSRRSDNLKQHIMSLHTGEKPFKCTVCKYSCSHSSRLKLHIRTHTGEKPYKCNICDYCSTRSSNLKCHMRKHTDAKSYKCNFCDFSSTYWNSLKVHVRTHTGERPHKCNICDFSATHSSSLKVHLRRHSGEKPFKCDTCNYSSVRSYRLKEHMRTHTGERPFKCPDCDFRSIQSFYLKKHMRKHAEEKSNQVVNTECDNSEVDNS